MVAAAQQVPGGGGGRHELNRFLREAAGVFLSNARAIVGQVQTTTQIAVACTKYRCIYLAKPEQLSTKTGRVRSGKVRPIFGLKIPPAALPANPTHGGRPSEAQLFARTRL